ncbi:MAG: DNA adenine methylase [Chloroflexi bacterium]|nr:DNA adenine methylase [Chloroflexota bacterium]
MDLLVPEAKLDPILKWPGGKQDELTVIIPAMPTHIKRYFEPFLGGGAVYLTIPHDIPAYVNDKSSDLILLYRMVATTDKLFFGLLDFIDAYWRGLEQVIFDNRASLICTYSEYRTYEMAERQLKQQVVELITAENDRLTNMLTQQLGHDVQFFIDTIRTSLIDKMTRMRKLEMKKGELPENDVVDNLEGALKGSFYYYVRHLYNYSGKLKLTPGQHAALFFFIREHAYASMFRFNKKRHFNIPYGGLSYNRKNFATKIARLRDSALQKRLNNTQFENLDFADFLVRHPPQAGDFIFLDPPYDTEFSSYDQNPFDKADQARLAHFLVHECQANFMLIIKSTEYILSLYTDADLNIQPFDKTYMYTVKERNNRDTIHLLITNY